MEGQIDKHELHRHCIQLIHSRIEELESEIASIQEAKFNETKSTAGDKYETGRAMMQAEEDRLKERRISAVGMLNALAALDLDTDTEKIDAGSLVISDQHSYFLSVGLGKIIYNDQTVYCISLQSPVGRALAASKAGDTIEVNGQRILIKGVS